MMRRFRWSHLVASVAVALVPAAVRAQGTPPAPAPKPLDVTVDIGYVSVTGNRTLTTFSFGDKLSYKAGEWLFAQTLTAVYARAEGTVNAEFYKTQGRADYALGSRFTVFGDIGWDRNRFAGIRNRVAEDVGVSYKAVTTDQDQFGIEAGGGFVQQQNLGSADQSFGTVRGAGTWKHNFSKTAYFQQFVEGIGNVQTTEEWRLNTESSLVAPISSHIALKIGYLVRYQNSPPINTALTPAAPYRKADFVFTTGLQITF
jgi:putative salt-induced outer membrane protein